MVNFNFDESEVINNVFEEGLPAEPNSIFFKEAVFKELSNLLENTDEPNLKEIMKSTISKLKTLSPTELKELLTNLPVIEFTLY